MKYYQIFIDGIDKCGKDTIAGYIDLLSGHKYVVKARGIISMKAYSLLFDRDYVYDTVSEKNVVNVLIDVFESDWKVRCKLTKEPAIDYAKHTEAFDVVYQSLMTDTNITHLLRFNSSLDTAYNIASTIINYMEEINNEK